MIFIKSNTFIKIFIHKINQQCYINSITLIKLTFFSNRERERERKRKLDYIFKLKYVIICHFFKHYLKMIKTHFYVKYELSYKFQVLSTFNKY